MTIIIRQTNPIILKELQRFFGFTNFYYYFIKGFSKIVKPLISFTKISRQLNKLLSDILRIFYNLKFVFITVSVFIFFDLYRKTVVEANVSDWTLKDIFFQYNSKEAFHFVVFFSVKYIPVEYNYKIYNKKFLIIVKMFEE